jgi:hypothetical protein
VAAEVEEGVASEVDGVVVVGEASRSAEGSLRGCGFEILSGLFDLCGVAIWRFWLWRTRMIQDRAALWVKVRITNLQIRECFTQRALFGFSGVSDWF